MTFPSAIIFDLDGTLVHSAPDIHAAANVALKTLNRPQLSLPEIISFIGNGIEVLMHRCLEATGGQPDDGGEQALEIFRSAYVKDMTTLTALYDGVEAFVGAAKAQGTGMGVCTNKPTAPASAICEELGLSGYFNTIVGAEPDRPKKPDPDMLLHTASVLGTPVQDCLYVGDSAIDQKTAQNTGMRFAFFTGGYLNTPLSGTAPDLTFDHWSELLAKFDTLA